jgi:hypothetical protein
VAAQKRTSFQRERDLERVADLHCRGLSQRAIAEQLQVSQPQIAYDMKRLQQRWQASALAKLERYKAEQLARIEHLEAEAWKAWDRSCQDGETASTSLVQGRTTKDGVSLPDLRTSGKVTKGQAGDPRFLERVGACIQERCRLFGLYALAKLAPTTPDGEQEYPKKLSDEEAAIGFARLLATLEARQLGPFAPGASDAARRVADQLRNGEISPFD